MDGKEDRYNLKTQTEKQNKTTASKGNGFLSGLLKKKQNDLCPVCGRAMKAGHIYRNGSHGKCCENCYLKANPPHKEKTISERLRQTRLNDEQYHPSSALFDSILKEELEQAKKTNRVNVPHNETITRRTWKCDICGHEYVVKPTPYYYKHDGKTYCVKCQRQWEDEQKKRREQEAAKQAQERKRKMLADFNTLQISEPYTGEKHVLLSAVLLTLDNEKSGEGTLWAKVQDGKTELHKTSYSHSEYSGYHDEENVYYSTTAVEKPEGWDDENWFESHEWVEKTAVQPELNCELSLDALYYEGQGQYETTRWQSRIWQTDTGKGTLVVYLRKCAEGYRLLRMSLGGNTDPFGFDFTENAVQKLFRQYAHKCYVFEDFALTENECAYIEEGLRGVNHNIRQRAYQPYKGNIGLIRRKGNGTAEESVFPEKVLSELLRIRCLNEEDYWVRYIQ